MAVIVTAGGVIRGIGVVVPVSLGTAVAHPRHGRAGVGDGLTPSRQPRLHLADLIALGGEDVERHAPHLGVGAVFEFDGGQFHTLLVVAGHVLRKADGRRVRSRGIVAGGVVGEARLDQQSQAETEQ